MLEGVAERRGECPLTAVAVEEVAVVAVGKPRRVQLPQPQPRLLMPGTRGSCPAGRDVTGHYIYIHSCNSIYGHIAFSHVT